MLTFRKIYFIAFLAAASSTDLGHDFNDNDPDSMILHEEFLPFGDAKEQSSESQSFLRRVLQSEGVCNPNSYTAKYVCGGDPAINEDPCAGSTATCSGLTYPCTCTGSLSSESSCSYCQIRTKNSIRCQLTNSKTTFVALNGTTITCACQYIGGGKVEQDCYTPAAAPVEPLPTWFPAPRPSVPASPAAAPIVAPSLAPVPPSTPAPVPSTQAPVDEPVAGGSSTPAPQPTEQPAGQPVGDYVYVPKETLRDQFKLYRRPRRGDMP